MGNITISCPACKQDFTIDNAVKTSTGFNRVGVDNGKFDDNDLTVCHECVAILRYRAGAWEHVTEEQFVELSIDDRTGLKRVQEVIARERRRGGGGGGGGEDREKALLHLAPWLALKKFGEIKTEQEAVGSLARKLSSAMDAITGRPYSSGSEDLLLITPIIFAQAYMISCGDYVQATEMINEYVRDYARDHGITDAEITDMLARVVVK